MGFVKEFVDLAFESSRNEAKTLRPRPGIRGQGQFLAVEAKAEAKK